MNEQAIARASDQQALGALLTGQKQRIEQLSGGSVSPDRLAQLAFLAVRKTPALQSCTVASVLAACLDAARLGLEPDGIQGAIIPYKGAAAFQPMYRGLIELTYREGTVVAIEVRVAFAGDDFRIELGSSPRITHTPSFSVEAEDRKPIAYYAVAHMRDAVTFDFMLPHEIEVIRKRAPSSARSSPWDTDYDEMAKKTVIKRLLKKLPSSSARLRDAQQHDNDIDLEVDDTPKTKTTATSATDKLLAAKAKQTKAKAEAVAAPQLPAGGADDAGDDASLDDIERATTPEVIDPPVVDDAPLIALMRAIPRVERDDAGAIVRTRHAQHLGAAKRALTEAGYQMVRLLTKDRLGETADLGSVDVATLIAARAKLAAAGGFVEQ